MREALKKLSLQTSQSVSEEVHALYPTPELIPIMIAKKDFAPEDSLYFQGESISFRP